MLAFITGSGLYDHDILRPVEVSTRFGDARVFRGSVKGRELLMLPRHGDAHGVLPHQINHRANLLALNELGATAVISCSVCGILDPDRELGRPMVARDLYFPDNRLGDGSICTVFTKPGESGRGHLLASNLVNADLSASIAAATEADAPGVYGHVPGPRFNTVAEIRALRAAGVDFISQTCGPEAVLANELELPWALAAFGIDYANGVVAEPTPVETLNANLERGGAGFLQLMETIEEPEEGFSFTNFVYRFE